jgi:hypothetical protein
VVRIKKKNEKDEYRIYTGKVTEVIWNQEKGRLVLSIEGEKETLIEFPIEHYNTARDLKTHMGSNVKLLVENGKITGLKPV